MGGCTLGGHLESSLVLQELAKPLSLSFPCHGQGNGTAKLCTEGKVGGSALLESSLANFLLCSQGLAGVGGEFPKTSFLSAAVLMALSPWDSLSVTKGSDILE